MEIGIIGCGLIGRKRSQNLSGATLISCADIDLEQAQKLAKPFHGCVVSTNWIDVVAHPEVKLVIIATPHNLLAEIALACITAGKHILIEKPASRNTRELQSVIAMAANSKIMVRVGFNHRYHRALQQAHKLVAQQMIGDLMFIRARYGHGGRLGYDAEWRAQPEISGGGELIDQGVHLIDLARWFLGEFVDIQGFAPTYYWKMPVDDNGFLLLKTNRQQVAFLHASCTEWKNIFSFEIYGKTGKLEINGLGGSYGVERLSYYKMLPEMGPPETTIWEYPMEDNSWKTEFNEFLEDIQLGRPPSATLHDAYAALKIVETICNNC